MTGVGWKTALEDARKARDVTPEQERWDGRFARWVGVALRSGRTSQAAVKIAATRTEDQYGPRPQHQTIKETT